MLCSKCRQKCKLTNREPELSSVEEINRIKHRNNIFNKIHIWLFCVGMFVKSATQILRWSLLVWFVAWFMLKGEECFSVLIRQQLISSQTACVLKQTTEPRAPEHVSVRRVQHSLTIAKSQHLKSRRHQSQGRPLRNVNTHKNSAGSYLLLERLLELTVPAQTKTKTFPMHVSNQPSRLNWPIP